MEKLVSDQVVGNAPDAEIVDAALAADEQGLLFTDDVSPLPSDLGYRGPTACNAAGITYRQLDYWARTGLVEPTVRGATGSGTQRLYSFRDILILKVIKRLLDAGISLQQIRTAVQHLLFGAEHEAVKAGRIATIQTIGGSGALKIGADLNQSVAYVRDHDSGDEFRFYRNAIGKLMGDLFSEAMEPLWKRFPEL